MPSLVPRDHAEAVALFRAEVVGALAHSELSRGELAAELRTLAERHQGKTLQQRQNERRLADEADDRALVEDMATKYTCSNAVAHDFVRQCDLRLDDLEFDLVCSTMALDSPPAAQPLVDLLRELADERRRHQEALFGLHERLLEFTRRADVHHHLDLPVEHYQTIVRQRVLLEDPAPRPVQISAVSGDR